MFSPGNSNTHWPDEPLFDGFDFFAKDVFLISLFFVSVPSSQQCADLLGPAEMGTEGTHGSWKTAHNVPQLS